MKPTHILLGKINALQQSIWIGPSLLMLMLLVAVLGLTGCQPHH